MKPLLSICIPTYNRSGLLKRTIESIIKQDEFIDEKVEIVVSDNASTDDTEDICKMYQKYPNFHYYKNKVNVGDKNFPLVLSRGTGQLRKLNNDTYILAEDSLKKLCQVVEQNKEERPVIFFSTKEEDNKILNFHDFVVGVSYWVTWIVSNAFWEEDCVDFENDFDGCELRLWQTKKTYSIAYKKNKILVCGIPFGTGVTPPKKNVSYGIFQVFYKNYMSLLYPYVKNGALTDDDIDYLEKDLLLSFFPDWLFRYDLQNTDMIYSKEEDLKLAIYNQYKDKPYWSEFENMYKKKLFIKKCKIRVRKILGKI